MTSITKPPVRHPGLRKNSLGYTVRDYEGAMSTLCAGCGHDSVTAALIVAFWELALPPHRAAKMSGIGCSSKTTAYFMRQSHGFNSVHGRMPSVLTGANLANRDLIYLGVSGDGDSASIGLGQFAHAMRRGVNMTYIVENNGVYGLTKGQASPTLGKGLKTKSMPEPSIQEGVNPLAIALGAGYTWIGRGYALDVKQLVTLVVQAISHQGTSFLDVFQTCPVYNDLRTKDWYAGEDIGRPRLRRLSIRLDSFVRRCCR